MRKLLAAVLLVAACTLPGAARASAQAGPIWAGTCGLPSGGPLWIDYGWPGLSTLFARPGVVVASSGGGLVGQLRDGGAASVFFDLYLKKRVGQPSAPADSATIVDRANKLYDYAVAQLGCSTPTMVENELFGAGLVPPWSQTNIQYRQNVLTFLRQLASRGAHPVLLINSKPYTDGEAGLWWQQAAAAADLVREVYVPATNVWKQGPIVGNRNLRVAYRRGLEDFTSLGVPAQRLGLMVSFATTPGFGGRNGLEPASAWFQVDKWEALATKTVAAELGIGSIWSWGWAQWTQAEQDPDKEAAACVWLWTRDQSLCDAPSVAGTDFDASLTPGQIILQAGTQCLVDSVPLSNGAIQRLESLTGDRDTAFTALYQRLVESESVPITGQQILAAEQSVIATRFGGSRSAYLSALAEAHASVQIARGILSDELRRVAVQQRLRAAPPGPTEVSTFYESYPDLLVRPVETKPGAGWLDGHTSGYLVSATAPSVLFSGGTRTVWTPAGTLTVKPLGPALPLGAVPISKVRPSIVGALRSFARGEAFERWVESQQQRALSTVVCARDDLPQPAAVELTTYLPFLQL